MNLYVVQFDSVGFQFLELKIKLNRSIFREKKKTSFFGFELILDFFGTVCNKFWFGLIMNNHSGRYRKLEKGK